MNEAEVQPTGVSVEETLAVVSHVLSDPEFAAEVRKQNDWKEDLPDQDTALLFLASRYQWSVALLSIRDETLKRQVEGLAVQVEALEARVSG